jgi:4-hydroxy-2-oxoglutarate aldolase
VSFGYQLLFLGILDPGAAGGIDLDSDIIIELAKECPNIVGCKLTCGNVGKLTRIASVVTSLSFVESHPRSQTESAPQFLVLGGFTDFLIPSTFAAGHGAITGLANVAPHACVRLFTMGEQLKADLENPHSKSDTHLLTEAIRLQGIVAQADRTLALAGISGTKAVLERMAGYGGNPRKPLPAISPKAAERVWQEPTVQALLKEEKIAASLAE